MISHKPFYFIRHGETDWNKKGIIMGQTDIPLNALGKEQAHAAAGILKDVEFKSIVSSPLSRALETAEIISHTKKMPVTVIDDLKECSWGEMEGTSKGDGVKLEEWRKGLRFFKGGETFSSFRQRVLRGLNHVLSQSEPVLVVAHGGVYSAMKKFLKISLPSLPNAIPYYHRPPQDPTHPWVVYEAVEGETW